MKLSLRFVLILTALIAAAVLVLAVACGGDDDEEGPAAGETPAAAEETPEGPSPSEGEPPEGPPPGEAGELPDIPAYPGAEEVFTGTFTGGATTIHLSLGEATEVSIVVYDVRGKRLRTVVNGTLPSGDHRIPWNGRDEADNTVANGVYFCRVKVGTVEQTVKMLMMQ